MNELISRQDAIDALGERPIVWSNDDEYLLGARNQYDTDKLAIETVPPAQSEPTRTFVELVVEYPNPELCTYKEYNGKPYYSIKYIENGEPYIGYGTYKPEVLSQYLKEYFISSAQQDYDKIIAEIKQCISETREHGKHHAKFVQDNGELYISGLEMALSIIEENR